MQTAFHHDLLDWNMVSIKDAEKRDLIYDAELGRMGRANREKRRLSTYLDRPLNVARVRSWVTSGPDDVEDVIRVLNLNERLSRLVSITGGFHQEDHIPFCIIVHHVSDNQCILSEIFPRNAHLSLPIAKLDVYTNSDLDILLTPNNPYYREGLTFQCPYVHFYSDEWAEPNTKWSAIVTLSQKAFKQAREDSTAIYFANQLRMSRTAPLIPG